MRNNYYYISEQKEILESLRKFYSEKGVELRRWQECYDIRVLKNFLIRLLQVVSEFDSKIDSLKENTSKEHFSDLVFMRQCLLDELDGEGLVSFGEELLGKNEVPEERRVELKIISVFTESENLDGQLFKVVERGFKLMDGDGEKLIRPAVLARYQFKPSTEK